MSANRKWTVIDLFSGAGGMSYGFHAHGLFRIVGAVDLEVAKPSSGNGNLECNRTYAANMAVTPCVHDLGLATPSTLEDEFAPALVEKDLDVLISCAPCTGFSRAIADNHLRDDPRNQLVEKSADYVAAFRPKIFLMENARELVCGNFKNHFEELKKRLSQLGYHTVSSLHFLDRFGLPQRRERAIILSVRDGLIPRSLEDLWDGFEIDPQATHVRRVISSLPSVVAGEAHPSDPLHVSPGMSSLSLRRLNAIPRDGGSWIDLRNHPDADDLLTPAMARTIKKGKFGSHPDVYGRMWWDRPAVTIKRECGHTGNGRYAHPEQDRLCTVREMAMLQGFPRDYVFVAGSVTNMYRHIGDAVPPLISFQLAHACSWILGGERPAVSDLLLPGTQLTSEDIRGSASRGVQLSLQVAGLA